MKLAVLVAVAVILTLVLYPRVRAFFPLVNDVEPSGDDWWSYHRNAVSVVSDGLSMPVVEGPYSRPGGFGYVYFVAAFYEVFGARSRVLYVVQAVLLVSSVLMYAFAARRRLPLLPFAVYAAFAGLFAYLDTFRFYTHRLLSENLLIFLLAALFLTLNSLVETRSWVAATAVGLLCGACFLTRPNTILIAPALALVHLSRRRDKRSLLAAAIIVAGFAVMAGLLVWRDRIATARSPSMAVLTTTRDWQLPPTAGQAFDFYARRVRYVLGDLEVLMPEYGQWPRWYFAWGGVALFAAVSLLRKRIDEFDQAAVVLIAVYYLPLIAVAQIENYGIRMLMPAMPIVLYLGARGVALATSRVPRSRRDRIP